MICAEIEDLGPRASLDHQTRIERRDQLLEGLGLLRFARIVVAPFTIESCGVEFGLIPRLPEEEGDVTYVELHPGNYMAFRAPWDSGIYDT